MNYRNCISENIPSLEFIFTEYLNADANHYEKNKIPSNRHTIYYLLFEQETLPSDFDEKTLFQHSILKDSFLEKLNLIDLSREAQYDEPLLYYIAHKNEPFPTNSKYSQFLSNIFQKNYTGKGQPPQVRTILNAIDPNKLSKHINNMIQKQNDKGNDLTELLTSYITNIFLAEPKFTEISGISHITNISDCLAWILLYALFDEMNFKNYCQYNTESKFTNTAANLSETIPPNIETFSAQQKKDYISAISNKCRNAIFYSKLSTYSLLTLTTIQLVCFIMPFFLYGKQNISEQHFLLYCITMLIIAVLLLTLRYIPYYFAQKAAEYKVTLDNLEANHLSIIPISEFQKRKTSHPFKIRERKCRMMLFLSLTILWLISLIISIYTTSFPILCAGLLISFAVFLHSDHIINITLNSINYCQIFEDSYSSKKKSALKGLAMRFAWDYDKESETFLHKNTSDLQNHSVNCIRYIFYSHVDRQEYLWTSYTIFSLLLNCIVLFIGIIQFILPFNSYFRILNTENYSIFCIAWMIISDLVYITLLLQTNQHYDTLIKYMNYSANPSLMDDFLKKVYQRAYNNGKISNIDIARGIFSYNCCMWNNNISATAIQPIDDRELVIHRYPDKLERLTLTSIAFYLAFLCIVVWHFHIIAGLWSIPVVLIFYPVFAFKLLPWLDQKFIKSCVKRYFSPKY